MERKPTQENAFHAIPEHEKDTIKDLQLSNAEWLRYRGSGELPERADEIMRVRLEAQMAGARIPPKKREVSIPARVDEENSFNPESLKHHLITIEGILDFGMKDVDILGLASKFHEELGLSYDKVLSDKKLFADIKKRVSKVIRRIADRFTGRDGNFDEQNEAELIEAAAYIGDYLVENVETLKMISQVVKQGRYNVISKLLGTSILCDRSFDILFWNKTDRDNKINVFDDKDTLKLALLLPDIVNYGGKKLTKYGLKSIENVSLMLVCIFKEIKKNSNLINELEKQKIDLQKIADDYFASVFKERDAISEGYPTHGVAGDILNTLTELYDTTIMAEMKPPTEMSVLLKKIYDKKVVPFSSPKYPHWLLDNVRAVCDVCGIDFDTITKKDRPKTNDLKESNP